ncbi:hypothetical protein [Kiloniella sp. b19]|uniref:hypothetical protein n=1 Tax=Kiloniella sp. GXU_MW_B19 TaxID=3141326 RepID=UPI0031E1D299
MLFGYPIEATEENWVHDSLIAIIRNLHQCADDGNNCTWPDIIPDDFKDNYARRRKGLFPKLEAYLEALNTLTVNEKAEVLECVDTQNNIPGLLRGECACNLLEDLPENIRSPLQTIFEYGFDMLAQKQIRDRSYKKIFDQRREGGGRLELVCPFCGDETFAAPGPQSIREDLDHYLPISKYPFAGANLRNLVPMGHTCNSKLKLQADPILVDGNTRKAYDPYSHEGTKISLKSSRPCEGERGLPAWEVEFDPDGEEAETWDAIFKIRERCKANILNPSYGNWMEEFATFYQIALPNNSDAPADIILGLQKYLELLPNKISNQNFLRRATFEMLAEKCQNQDVRTIRHVQNLIENASS